ncbi:MAG: hypothetical protein FWG47_05040 [Propionibacteriaceae bacterium]|nr:hypothetical protein [Propionibacteriaceae bacterium]
MDEHGVLIHGDTTIEALVGFLSGLNPGVGDPYEHGLMFERGIRVIDSAISNLYYEDSLGFPLSQYRFEIASKSETAHEDAARIFEILSEKTDLNLLWLKNVETVEGERTLTPVI